MRSPSTRGAGDLRDLADEVAGPEAAPHQVVVDDGEERCLLGESRGNHCSPRPESLPESVTEGTEFVIAADLELARYEPRALDLYGLVDQLTDEILCLRAECSLESGLEFTKFLVELFDPSWELVRPRPEEGSRFIDEGLSLEDPLVGRRAGDGLDPPDPCCDPTLIRDQEEPDRARMAEVGPDRKSVV